MSPRPSDRFRFELAKDLQRELGIFPDLGEDLRDVLLTLVGFVCRVLEGDAVLLGLTVARQQNDWSCVCGLKGKDEVEKNEWIRIPVGHEDAPDVEVHPCDHQRALRNDEWPRTHCGRELVGDALAGRRLLVMCLVDWMLVVCVGIAMGTAESMRHKSLDLSPERGRDMCDGLRHRVKG